MADKEAQLTIKAKVENRVGMSESLLERMGISADQYTRIVLNALVTNPGLADCDSDSMDKAVMHCITAGLIPDGKQAAIVPFRDNSRGALMATLIPMIEGRISLARRATPGLSLRVRLVYKDDEWEYLEGMHPTLKHKVNPNAERIDANIVAAYAVAHLPYSTTPEFEWFYRSDIDRYRAYSRSKDKGPWVTHYGEQAKKSVLGQLLKRLPKAVGAPPEPPAMSTLEADAMALDDMSIADPYVEEAPQAQEPAAPQSRRSRQPAPTVVDSTTGEITDTQPPADEEPPPPVVADQPEEDDSPF